MRIEPPWTLEEVVDRVEQAVKSEGLRVSMRGTLRSYPGCVHWHLQRPGASGTLELTAWPQEQRVWFKVQSSRKASWIDERLPLLKAEIERRVVVKPRRSSSGSRS